MFFYLPFEEYYKEFKEEKIDFYWKSLLFTVKRHGRVPLHIATVLLNSFFRSAFVDHIVVPVKNHHHKNIDALSAL